MAFEGLKARIQAQVNEAHNQRYLNDMVMDAQSVIRQNAPNLTGVMVRNLTTATTPVPTSYGLHAGLGDRSLVGSEDDSAPRGMIAKFLEDHRDNTKPKKKRKSSGKFDKRKAWSYLSEEQKTELQNARLGGEYGGVEGGSPYFFQQEGSLDDWSRGAYPANIRPTRFLERSMDEWRKEWRGMVVSQYLKNSGFRGR